jgi:hypothetical protein
MSQSQPNKLLSILKTATWVIAGITALLTLLLLPLWILGVPGTRNNYAIGWSLGLATLFQYLIGCCITLATFGISALTSRKYPASKHVSTAATGAFWVFFSYSIFNIYRAFDIMLKG